MYSRWVALVAVFIGLSSALNGPVLAQSEGTQRGAADQPMEHDAALSDIEEVAPEPGFQRPQQSFLAWFLISLGWRYTVLLPAATLLSFILLCLLLIYGRGWAAGAAAVLLVPLPLLVGLLGTIEGLIQSYTVIASLEVTLKPSEVAHGMSTALVASLAGLCLMFPNYWLAVIGLLVRSMREDRRK